MRWRRWATGLLLFFVVFSLGYFVGKEVTLSRTPTVDAASSAAGTMDAPPRRLVGSRISRFP